MKRDRQSSEGFVGHSVVPYEWSQLDIWRKQSISSRGFCWSELGQNIVDLA